MVLVVRQALVDLGSRPVPCAARDEGVHRLAGLQEADHVMDSDARALDAGVTAPHARGADDVSVRSLGRAHAPSL